MKRMAIEKAFVRVLELDCSMEIELGSKKAREREPD